jgi:hypothetical protein
VQIRFESGVLNPPSLILTLPSRVRESHSTRPTLTPSLAALRQAQQEALRGNAFEQKVWFALALASLGVLIVSLWI